MADVKDAVCGTEFPEEMANEESGAFKVEHRGKTHWFCSVTCAEAFRKEPERYLRRG